MPQKVAVACLVVTAVVWCTCDHKLCCLHAQFSRKQFIPEENDQFRSQKISFTTEEVFYESKSLTKHLNTCIFTQLFASELNW